MSRNLSNRWRPTLRRPSRSRRVSGSEPSVWSAGPFRTIWLASTISDFGIYVSALALPLTAVVTLDASPFQMGLLTAVEWLPFVALGLSDVLIGVILSLGGVGAVIGSLLCARLQRRLGFGRAMVWAMLVCCAASLLVPLAFVFPAMAVPLLATAELVQYGTLAIFNIGGRTLRQVLAADAVQGRVNATARTLIGAGTLVGSLAGGLLGGWIGLGNTLIVGAIGMMLAIPIVLLSPLRSLHALPAASAGEDEQDSVLMTGPGAPVATR